MERDAHGFPSELIHRPTTRFYDVANVRNPERRRRQDFKSAGLAPFIDHDKTFAQKPASQRGPAKLSQTFIVSRPYFSRFSREQLEELAVECTDHGLEMFYEKSVFRGLESWLIVVSDEEVDLEVACQFARSLQAT